jgi:anti-sigma factor RsiW
MKPCRQHRKSIALFAANSLSPSESELVQAHLDRCAPCKDYHAQILAVCQRQTKAAAHLQTVVLPTRVYDRVAQEIENSTAVAPTTLVTPLRTWLPRVAAAALVLALIIGAWKFDRSSTQVLSHQVDPSISAVTATSPSTSENHTSLGFYRKTVIRSLDDLDRLVNQQADRVEGFAASPRLNQGLID